jgi:hypothetical protein
MSSYPLPADHAANGECKAGDAETVDSEGLRERTLHLWRELGEPDVGDPYNPAEAVFIDFEGYLPSARDKEVRLILAVLEAAFTSKAQTAQTQGDGIE